MHQQWLTLNQLWLQAAHSWTGINTICTSGQAIRTYIQTQSAAHIALLHGMPRRPQCQLKLPAQVCEHSGQELQIRESVQQGSMGCHRNTADICCLSHNRLAFCQTAACYRPEHLWQVPRNSAHVQLGHVMSLQSKSPLSCMLCPMLTVRQMLAALIRCCRMCSLESFRRTL